MPMAGRSGASVGEQHVREDLGAIPSFADWARLITPQAWMLRGHPLDGAEGVTIDMPLPGERSSFRGMSHLLEAAVRTTI
jgi:hypothetical protein